MVSKPRRPRKRMIGDRRRRWIAGLVMGTVVLGIATVTHVSYADTDDMYNTYDAIAAAKKIPDAQGPDPECAGTAVTPAAAASLEAARRAGSGRGSATGAP